MFEQYWELVNEVISDRDPDTLVGWPENYPYVADCHKIIDIGCGIGNVVTWLKKRGHIATGITCNKREVDVARGRGEHEVGLADMHQTDKTSDFFDAFTMWDSLEHSIAPLLALLEARRITRKGGKGMIFIPGQNWIDYDAHIVVPTRAQMTHLLKQAGLEIFDIVDMSNNGLAPEQAVYKVVVK